MNKNKIIELLKLKKVWALLAAIVAALGISLSPATQELIFDTSQEVIEVIEEDTGNEQN